MRDAKVKDLRARSDKAWAHLRAQLHGMDPYLDRSDIPGEWTAREVLCHLLFEPGWKPVPLLKTFAVTDLPVVHVNPGDADVTGNRKTMTFKQFMGIEEIDIPTFVGALFDYHWNDHAGQIAKIRKSVGLPEAK